MSKWRDIYFKKETGKSAAQILKQRTTARQVIDSLIEEEQALYPPRWIGYNEQEGKVYLQETDRYDSTHILGTTKQGKSKYLEMSMCMDIHMLMDKTLEHPYRSGFLFIDSTEHGATVYKVLKYCMRKGFTKVLLIDPHYINHPKEELRYTVPINPLDYDAPSETMASHIADSLRVLWKTEDFKDESIITRNLRFFVEVLHKGGYIMAECEQLIVPSLANQRTQMLANDRLSWVTKQELARVYHSCKDTSWNDVQPTLRRFDPFTHSSMKSMFGSKKGINFRELITDGWIILCNLHKSGIYDTPQQRLVGTVVLNEIVRARERMPSHTVPFHVYIDEFAFYVTDKITELLMLGRHLHIYLTLAHQGFFQIDMPKVRAAVKTGCKCKILFWTPDDKDLYEMIGMMYGGSISDREVKFVLSGLKKQQAAMKIGKQPTRICELRDWPDTKKTPAEVEEFVKHLFTSNPHLYRPVKDVWGEITTRFASTTIRKPEATPNVKHQTNAAPRPTKDDNPGLGAGTEADSNPAGETDAAGPSKDDFTAALKQGRKGRKR